MLVSEIKKDKKKYIVTIDEKEYSFSEETVVQYRFLKGHETSINEIEEAISFDQMASLYLKACNYQIRYGKNEAEIKKYLLKNGASDASVDRIIAKMKQRKLIDENSLLDSLITTYIRNGNGREMIRYKLMQKGYSKEDVFLHLERMDMDEYYDALHKLYLKIEHKYDKENSYVRRNKIIKYLLSRGYTYGEIERVA